MLLKACRRWEQALLGPCRLYNWGLREKTGKSGREALRGREATCRRGSFLALGLEAPALQEMAEAQKDSQEAVGGPRGYLRGLVAAFAAAPRSRRPERPTRTW